MREIRLKEGKQNSSDESSDDDEKDLSKEQAFGLWHTALKDVPDDYEFVIRSDKMGYPKGSQVYLSYGPMSNRDALKRYGFCLNQNKYNNIFIKLRLEQNDPEFKYRRYIINKFFSLDLTEEQTIEIQKLAEFEKEQKIAEKPEGAMDIMSRHFKIYYQKLNTKVLKFIKILTFNVKDDDLSCIIETRSMSLEYLSLKKLKTVYMEFLATFPTSFEEDMEMLRGPERKDMSVRKFFAIQYRSE